jgi:hypothetical protein
MEMALDRTPTILALGSLGNLNKVTASCFKFCKVEMLLWDVGDIFLPCESIHNLLDTGLVSSNRPIVLRRSGHETFRNELIPLKLADETRGLHAAAWLGYQMLVFDDSNHAIPASLCNQHRTNLGNGQVAEKLSSAALAANQLTLR